MRSRDKITYSVDGFYRHLEIDYDEVDVIQHRRDINCLMTTLGYTARDRARILQILGLVRDLEVKEEYRV